MGTLLDNAALAGLQLPTCGMGVAVSGWLLACTISRRGQLGFVSGIALAVVLANRL